jgi:two-component system LytT family response regulator
MKAKAVLIDDEQHNLDNLTALLTTFCPEVEVTALALSAEAGRALLQSHNLDILFLDIQMTGQNGFDLLRSLPELDFEVIFVTAYDQYAIQAMRFAAVDYLLKPVDITELKAAVARAIAQRQMKAQNLQLSYLMQLLKGGQGLDEQRIALASSKETRFVKTSEIIRCESSNNYTTFYLTDDAPILVCKPIYEYEDLLKEHGFMRCHQSHLVNKKFIKSWKKDYGDTLLLTDGVEVPISRGKKEEVKKALQL